MIVTDMFWMVTGFLVNFLSDEVIAMPMITFLAGCLFMQFVSLFNGKKRENQEKLNALAEEAQYWKIEAQRAKANLLSEQLNPHFLFNNLGSLSELIEEDPSSAIQFVEELATVYRYILKVYNIHVSSLKEEKAFLDNYFGLLRLRFGNNLHLDINIPDQYLDSQIPPLTLQLLLENAVKHNVITNEKPLYVSVYLHQERLVMENNIQPKTASLFSGKIGLQYIREKLRLLKAGELEVDSSGSIYQVTVPLVQITSGNGFSLPDVFE